MATVLWIGRARTVQAVRPYTVGGTIVGGTFGFTIGAKTISIAGVTDAATTAAALQALLAASTEPEFAELTWTVAGAVITITGPTDGAPISITTVTAGSGTLTLGTTVTGTSPNHLSAVANYSSGALPANSDTLIFPPDTADVLYDLDALSAKTGLTIWRQAGGPRIGLQDWRAAGFREVRQRHLIAGISTLRLDLGNTADARALRFDLNAGTTTVYVTGTTASNFGAEAAEVLHPGAVTAYVNGGSVAFTSEGGGGTYGITSLSAVNCTASVSTSIPITSADYVRANGRIESNYTALRMNGGGVVEAYGTAAGTPTIDGGTFLATSTGTLTNPVVGSDGALDLSAGVGAVAISGVIYVYERSTINDPSSRLTKSYVLEYTRCGAADVTLNLGEHFKSTIATY